MKNFDELCISIDYTFSSGIGALEEGRYIREAKAVVYNGEYADNNANEYIGELEFKLLYLEQAKEDGFSLNQIFDMYEYTFRHAQAFYDFEYGDFKTLVYKHYNESLFKENLCIIETMTLLPRFRGYGIGPRLFKDLVFHFKYFSSLFVLQPYPLQFDFRYKEGDIKAKMQLESFEKNKVKASKKLTAYYRSWGLEKIKGIKDLLFYNAELRNEHFDQINLED